MRYCRTRRNGRYPLAQFPALSIYMYIVEGLIRVVGLYTLEPRTGPKAVLRPDSFVDFGAM